MKIFSLLDTKANSFGRPFPEKDVLSALRNFEIGVNESNSMLSRFPDDFCLMEIGEFEASTGRLTSHQSPMNISTARNVLRTSAPGSAN